MTKRANGKAGEKASGKKKSHANMMKLHNEICTEEKEVQVDNNTTKREVVLQIMKKGASRLSM